MGLLRYIVATGSGQCVTFSTLPECNQWCVVGILEHTAAMQEAMGNVVPS